MPPLPDCTYCVAGQVVVALIRNAYTPLSVLHVYPQIPELQTAVAPGMAFGQVIPQPPQ
jgi:hypothetical protein